MFGAVAGGGGAIGLLLGGVLTSYLSWRWCLYVNLVFAAAALVGGWVFLINPQRGERPRLDLLGTVLASGGLFAIVFGFSRAQTYSWGSPSTWVPLAIGVVFLLLFVITERIVAHPLLPLRIVTDRNRGGAYVAVGLTFLAGFSIFLFLDLLLATGSGFLAGHDRGGISAATPQPGCFFGHCQRRLLPRFGSGQADCCGTADGSHRHGRP